MTMHSPMKVRPKLISYNKLNESASNLKNLFFELNTINWARSEGESNIEKNVVRPIKSFRGLSAEISQISYSVH